MYWNSTRESTRSFRKFFGSILGTEDGGGGGSGYLNKDIVTRSRFCTSGSMGGGTAADGSDGGDGSARFKFVGL